MAPSNSVVTEHLAHLGDLAPRSARQSARRWRFSRSIRGISWWPIFAVASGSIRARS
jgi:hypothetical protein